MATVVLARQAEKSFLKLPLSGQKKISKAIEKVMNNPILGEKLKGEFEGQYKLVAWPYRIIYLFDQEAKVVSIIEIDHRQGIYK